ncbi:phage holin family protein [Georgenia faecalis]|uniref:Phage holin family protein n=1 Tax=Georgenia faecalis TaxID=2483799 RepID=A0ABV9DD56_9MICO|nr:phage holin family protein [Georgenia faecalis]
MDQYETPTGATAMPVTPGKPGTSVGEIVARLSDQFRRLVRDELQLAQAEVSAKGKQLGVGAGILAGAALFAFFGLALLITAAVLGLAEAVPAWLSAIIVAVVLFIIAAVAALIGKKRLQAGAPPTPEAAKRNVKQDIDAVKKGFQS